MKKLNAEWTIDGNVERACKIVEYDAMIIGGNGGNSGCVGPLVVACDAVLGW